MKNNNTKQDNVVGELLKQGVTDVVAKELAQTYKASHILAQIHLLAFRKPKANPAGLLVTAIRENWSTPASYRPDSTATAYQDERAKQDTEEEQKRRDEAEQIALIKAQLTNEELKALKKEAQGQVARILRAKYGDKIPRILIDSLMNHIIRVRYLKTHNASQKEK